MLRLTQSRFAIKQIPLYAAGFDDAMIGHRGRQTFDVSAHLFANKADAEAHVEGKVISVHVFWCDDEAERDAWIKRTEEARARYVENLSKH